MPGSEDAWDARLEQVVGSGRVAGEDEAVGIARERIVQPVRTRLSTATSYTRCSAASRMCSGWFCS